MPVLSLVTGTVNRPEDFHRLLNSIRTNTDVEWELVVADGSDDPIYTHDLGPEVRVIYERPRKGYVRAYNAAFRECRGDWVIWLNDDAEVLPGYASTAVNFMKSHPTVGLGCLAFRDRLWPNEFRVCTHWRMPYANFGIMPRAFGNEIGWFWEGLRMYGSDNAITFDVILIGKAVAEIYGPLIHHYRPEDSIRIANQVGRTEDNRRLTERYVSKIQILRGKYASTRIKK